MLDQLAAVVLVKNDAYWLPYALEASRGFFSRYVIYDIGSKDGTQGVIQWFRDSCGDDISFYVRMLPHLPPGIQGIFRNSMIAECMTELYFILDGDELYSPSSYQAIIAGAEAMLATPSILYGVVRRLEVTRDLKRAWGTTFDVPHHRIYRRTAIWKGPHPGEAPVFRQRSSNELWVPDAVCIHMHGTDRSPEDNEVPGRIQRREKQTYQPGDLGDIDLISQLPILRKPIGELNVNPVLKELQAQL